VTLINRICKQNKTVHKLLWFWLSFERNGSTSLSLLKTFFIWTFQALTLSIVMWFSFGQYGKIAIRLSEEKLVVQKKEKKLHFNWSVNLIIYCRFTKHLNIYSSVCVTFSPALLYLQSRWTYFLIVKPWLTSFLAAGPPPFFYQSGITVLKSWALHW